METNEITTKETNSYSKSTLEMLEQGMKYLQNQREKFYRDFEQKNFVFEM